MARAASPARGATHFQKILRERARRDIKGFPPRGGPAPGARSARVSSRAVPPQRGGMGDDGRVVPPGCPFLGPDSHERSSFQAVAACRLLADPAAPCEPVTAVGPAAVPFHTPAPSAPGVPPLFPGGLLHRQRPPLLGPA